LTYSCLLADPLFDVQGTCALKSQQRLADFWNLRLLFR
jgi:hypothetical protein